MKQRSCIPLLVGLALLTPPGAQAHFPILIHNADLRTTNGLVTITWAVGHPFELDMEPAKQPAQLHGLDPRGTRTNLTPRLRQTAFRGIPGAVAWECVFEPLRGDTLLALDSAPEIDPAQKTLYREYVKVWIHRGRQDAWTQRTGQSLEIVPLTRPYGLRPGMVFAGRLLHREAPVADTEVYFERLNEAPPDPKTLPPEPLITFAVRTDRDGRFMVSLPDAGWWVLGAYANDLGTTEHAGATFRLEAFAGLWIRVENAPRPLAE
jgi:cobalt/nickel transport protein